MQKIDLKVTCLKIFILLEELKGEDRENFINMIQKQSDLKHLVDMINVYDLSHKEGLM